MAGPSSLTVITTFDTSPGTCEDLLDLLKETVEGFIRHQPGFVSSTLHVNEAHTRVANYSRWERREDFLSMLRSAEMRQRNRQIAGLCRSFEPVMYEVVETFGD
jgi:quinol monooxygenase YgiN